MPPEHGAPPLRVLAGAGAGVGVGVGGLDGARGTPPLRALGRVLVSDVRGPPPLRALSGSVNAPRPATASEASAAAAAAPVADAAAAAAAAAINEVVTAVAAAGASVELEPDGAACPDAVVRSGATHETARQTTRLTIHDLCALMRYLRDYTSALVATEGTFAAPPPPPLLAAF